MSESVTVSVVIVSWNAKAFLAQCLASLTERACAYPMEVIVVDNASSDGSAEMVEREFPQVRLIRSESNLGFARGNNRGIRESRGQYICLINSDVEVRPDCITRLVNYCEAHPEVGMVGPRIMGGDGKLQRSCRGFPTVWNMFCRALALDAIFPRCRWFGGYLLPYWDHNAERPVDILSGCFWTVRRTALESVGLLDESFFMYGEDMDWCKRFWAKGWPLVFVPDAEAVHYGGASSAGAPVRFFIEKQRADLQYWRKHHSWVARQCYFGVAFVYHSLRVVGYALAWLASRGGAVEWRFKMARSVRCLSWMLRPGKVPV